ncbi:MAG: hypothetical protein GXP27_16780 [Planctomycetes bacterium]|nr:hypothetical protein [Planctomycetota bacterium]
MSVLLLGVAPHATLLGDGIAENAAPTRGTPPFSSDRSDPYYSLEENSERASLTVPRLATIENEHARLIGKTGKQARVAVGDSAWGWTVAVVAGHPSPPLVVLERQFDRWGLLAILSPKGTTLLRKAVGRLNHIATASILYPNEFQQALLASRGDLLGRKLLERQDDPSFEACASQLPDLTAYTFLAVEESDRAIAVAPDGQLGFVPTRYGRKRLEPVVFDPNSLLPAHGSPGAKRGLVGGWLPVIDYGFFDSNSQLGWEEIAFAWWNPDRKSVDVFVSLRIVKRGATERRYFRIALAKAPAAASAITPEEFFAKLLELKRHWDSVFARAMQVTVPEPRVRDACRASLVRAFITYDGVAPRYGVGHYALKQHATFPPTTLSMVNACSEWGLLDRAGRYLDYYLQNVVRPDGTFNYYGPAVSEYGQLLDAVARYARRSGRMDWFRDRWPIVERIVDRLLALRRAAEAAFPEDDVRHGLIKGSPEADTRKEVNFYYSGNLWTCRGWLEVGRLLTETGDAELAARGRKLLAEAEALRADIYRSLERSVRRESKPPFVPPVVGFDRPFNTMTQNRFASYTNYRYWIEMVSSGLLPPEWHDAIVAYRQSHGGELLGTTRFAGHLDDWPYAGYAYGLLLRDRARHFLLGFYGDLAVHRMRGTFTAYEQVAIRTDEAGRRTYVADYCVPAQLVTPLLARWMLVFEEPDADVLWLCRATPTRWLVPGQGIAVRRATTRWGPIHFSVTPRPDGTIHARIELPKPREGAEGEPGDEKPKKFPAEIRLRLRTPSGQPIARVTLNGHPHHDIDRQGEFIRIVRPADRTLDLTVSLGAATDSQRSEKPSGGAQSEQGARPAVP